MKLKIVIHRPGPKAEVVHDPSDLMSDPVGAVESSLPSNFPSAAWWAQYMADRMGAFTRKEGKRISNYKVGDWYERPKKRDIHRGSCRPPNFVLE